MLLNTKSKVQRMLESFHPVLPLLCALVRRPEPLRESEWRTAKNDKLSITGI